MTCRPGLVIAGAAGQPTNSVVRGTPLCVRTQSLMVLPNEPNVKPSAAGDLGQPSTNGHAAPQVLPEVTGMLNAHAALAYAEAGFHVIPVRLGSKNPGSYLGR